MNPFALVLLLIMLAVVLPFYFANARRGKEIQSAFDLQKRILDKFGSNSELLAYLESDAGKRLAEMPGVGPRHVYLRVLTALQAGIILVAAGSTIIFARRFIENSTDQHRMAFIGALGLGLGIGCLVSAGVTYGIAKAWRLLQEDPPRQRVPG